MKTFRSFLFIITFSFVFFVGCSLELNVPDSPTSFDSKIASTTIEKTIAEVDEENIILNEVYEEVVKSVVTLEVFDNSNARIGSGSGVIVAEDDDYAYLYTNSHVTDGGNYFEVVFHNFKRGEATYLQGNLEEDVAILRVEKSNNYEVATMGNSSSLSIGQSIFAVGSPLGLEYANTLTSGVISNTDIRVSSNSSGISVNKNMIQIDASLNPGNSGGPLFTKDGRVIGINTLKITNSPSGEKVESFNFAIPINHFDLVAETLLESGEYSRPKLGILIDDITSIPLIDRQQKGINLSYGLIIEEIGEGSASEGVLEEGTIITHIGGIKIKNLNEFSYNLLKFLPEDNIEITYYDLSDQTYNNVSIVLGE